MTKKPGLVLGWRLTMDSLEPVYLQKPREERGDPNDHDLLRVPATFLNHHTAIVAQSGSGKSFFIGRLIEELLINTKARCVILDPNSDFRLISKTSVARPKSYHKELAGKDPKDADFPRYWLKIGKQLYGGSGLDKKDWLKLPWAALPSEVITTEQDKPKEQDELYNCHQFIKTITALLAIRYKAMNFRGDMLSKANEVFGIIWPTIKELREAKVGADERALAKRAHQEIKTEFGYTKDERKERKEKRKEIQFSVPFLRTPIDVGTIDGLMKQAVDHARGFDPDVQARYEARRLTYKTYGFVETEIDEIVSKRTSKRPKRTGTKKAPRIEVIDLPSFKDEAQLAAVGAALALIWENARREWSVAIRENRQIRAPTFIVVEEAHNLISVPEEGEESLAKSVREFFRKIAAEGRKYGLFLIICTQRPDKIDQFVVSECENIAVMKLGSPSVMDKVQESFGLENIPESILDQCQRFTQGKAMLTGPWAGAQSQVFVYSGLRRIEESAKRLATNWRDPAPEISKEMEKVEREKARSLLRTVRRMKRA